MGSCTWGSSWHQVGNTFWDSSVDRSTASRTWSTTTPSTGCPSRGQSTSVWRCHCASSCCRWAWQMLAGVWGRDDDRTWHVRVEDHDLHQQSATAANLSDSKTTSAPRMIGYKLSTASDALLLASSTPSHNSCNFCTTWGSVKIDSWL